ncbi:MAG TPA: hypothetical protein VMR77_02990 [Patescibacteria group bacterium]|jgi:hypothetical protein|nr:hypothetical protein [Patescibacteria group bacterium]
MSAENKIHWSEEDIPSQKDKREGIRNSAKEFYSNLTGKKLVAGFLGLQLLDIAMTNADLTMFHGGETNFLGGAELMSSLGTENTELIKLGISTLLIGAYILSSIHEKELHIFKSRIKSKYVTEKTLQGLTALMTGIFLWNSFNLGIDIIANIKF